MDIVEELRTHHWPSAAGSKFLTEQQNRAADEIDALRAQLTESQAREAKLRRALETLTNMAATFPSELFADHPDVAASRESLALPHDDSALKERLKAEREKCAKVCDTLDSPSRLSDPGRSWITGTLDCAAAIRAMGDE